MGSFFSLKFYYDLFSESNNIRNLLFLGLANAGKTTLMCKFNLIKTKLTAILMKFSIFI